MNSSPVFGNPTFPDGSFEIFIIAILAFPVWIAVTISVSALSCFKLRKNASAIWRWLPTLIPITAILGLAPCLFFAVSNGIILWAIMTCFVLLAVLAYIAVRLGPTHSQIE